MQYSGVDCRRVEIHKYAILISQWTARFRGLIGPNMACHHHRRRDSSNSGRNQRFIVIMFALLTPGLSLEPGRYRNSVRRKGHDRPMY